MKTLPAPGRIACSRCFKGVQLKVLVNQHPPEPIAPSLPSGEGKGMREKGGTSA